MDSDKTSYSLCNKKSVVIKPFNDQLDLKSETV